MADDAPIENLGPQTYRRRLMEAQRRIATLESDLTAARTQRDELRAELGRVRSALDGAEVQRWAKTERALDRALTSLRQRMDYRAKVVRE